MSDFHINLLIQFPIFVVCVFLLIASIMQTRGEKGGILIIIGAAVLVLHRLVHFMHGSFFSGRLFDLLYEKMDMDIDATSMILNLVWAGIQIFLFTGLLLIAIGIFLRPRSQKGLHGPE